MLLSPCANPSPLFRAKARVCLDFSQALKVVVAKVGSELAGRTT
jgi:hypothetical protein